MIIGISVSSAYLRKKSPYVMQVLSDVLNIPVKVAQSDQAGALGAAMFAACAGGVYDSVKQAQENMGSGFIETFSPEPGRVERLKERYGRYREIGGLLESILRK